LERSGIRGVVEPVGRDHPPKALTTYTARDAYAGFGEDRFGTIAPGRLADLSVLDADPLAVAPDQLRDIAVRRKVVNGTERFVA
jgi:predicted amidohydrolase YtcJ